MSQLISDLDTPQNKDGIDFDTFLDAITAELGDKTTKDGIYKIFKLFDDDNTESIDINNPERVAQEIGEDMNIDELMEMIQRTANQGD